jgi:hypothetical protein
MMQVNTSLYRIVHYAGNGDTRRIEFTDKGLKLAAIVAFQGKFKPLSGQGVKMLLVCVNQGRFNTLTTEYSSNTVNELMEPWSLAHDGAVLWPENHQPWEADDDVFFKIDNPKHVAGNWINSTFHAELAADLINAELERLKARIRVSQCLCAAS